MTFNVEPAKDYKTLLRQFNSAVELIIEQKRKISDYMQDDLSVDVAKLRLSLDKAQDETVSERIQNGRLTAEVYKLRHEIHGLEKILDAEKKKHKELRKLYNKRRSAKGEKKV